MYVYRIYIYIFKNIYHVLGAEDSPIFNKLMIYLGKTEE